MIDYGRIARTARLGRADMVAVINKEYFAGTQMVTRWTCRPRFDIFIQICEAGGSPAAWTITLLLLVGSAVQLIQRNRRGGSVLAPVASPAGYHLRSGDVLC